MEVAFRRNHVRPPVKRASEGERTSRCRGEHLRGKDLKTTQRIIFQNQLREAGEPGVTHGIRMRHVRGVSIKSQNGARGRAVLTYGRECVAGSRGLQGEGTSRKAHGGTRTAKGQTRMGKDKWHKLRGCLPR